MNCGVKKMSDKKKLGILVSAFPGCGKSWAQEYLKGKYDILDLNSADFH